MRIALVAPDCNKRDGQARYVSELAERLAERHEVAVVANGFADTDAARVRHVKVAAPSRRTRLRFFLFHGRATRAVRRLRFDIVHGLGASCRGMDVITAQFVQAAYAEVIRKEAPGLGGGPVDAALRRLVSRKERMAFADPKVSRLIVVSRRVGDDVRRFYGRSRGIRVLPQGVDLERFRPLPRDDRLAARAELQAPEASVLLVLLGEFERKNLATVIRALARSRDPRLFLAAVGGSDPEPHRRLAAELGVLERVRFHPRTLTPERCLQAADAFVFPSFYDPFGTVTLEAAAAGACVVTTRRVGFAEWLEDGRSGFLLEDPRDEASLASILDRLAASPELREAVAARGRAVAQDFSWATVARRTEALYEEVLAERAGPSPAPGSDPPSLTTAGS